jgi:Cdc6-like AAA superfamily ATPase
MQTLWLGSRCFMKSAGDDAAGTNSSKDLSYRAHERQQLKAVLNNDPAAIQLLLGPRSCGKTAFLLNYTQQQQRRPPEGYAREETLCQAVCYIDFRGIDTTTPAGIARALVKDALPVLISKLPNNSMEEFKRTATDAALMLVTSIIAKASLQVPTGSPEGVADVSKMLGYYVEQRHDNSTAKVLTSPMDVAIESLTNMLQLWEKSYPEHKPVLVFDEADKLTRWQHKYEAELDLLLSFLVKVTKQHNGCHVLLVTSFCGFLYWLQESK